MYDKSEWTYYMSVKRKMVKKKNSNAARIYKLLNAGKKTSEQKAIDDERKQELKKIRQK